MVIVNNMAIIEELVQTISRIVTKATGLTTGVELVCTTLTKHKLLIPFNRSATSVCDANKAQTIDPHLTGVELVCVMLTKHKLLIPI